MNIDTITTQGVSTMKNNLPPFIEIYRALIATPSISATEEALDQSNESLINLLAGWFRDLGFNVEIQPVPDTRHKFNLLASTGHGAGGLLLAGHTDTVPFDDGRWTRDPFTLTEHDNKLYGLGTADMKGFFAFILDALRDVDVTTLKNRCIFWPPPTKRPAWPARAILPKPPSCARTAPSSASPPPCSRSAPIKAICPTRSVFRASPATPAIRRAGSTRLS
jgi:hypothetical protein